MLATITVVGINLPTNIVWSEMCQTNKEMVGKWLVASCYFHPCMYIHQCTHWWNVETRRTKHNVYTCTLHTLVAAIYMVKGYILIVPVSLPMATSDCNASYANAEGFWGNPWLNTCMGNHNEFYTVIPAFNSYAVYALIFKECNFQVFLWSSGRPQSCNLTSCTQSLR